MGGRKAKVRRNNELNFLNKTRIDHEDKLYSAALDDIQGNILKGHDRNNAIIFFLKFEVKERRKLSKRKQGKVKEQIAKFAKFKWLTSTFLQLKEWELFHRYKIPGGPFVHFLLSAKGYEALGISLKGFDAHFVKGMQSFKDDLNDLDPQHNWEPKYQNSEDIHALLLIAEDGEGTLGGIVRIILSYVLQNEKGEEMASIVGVEHASQLRNGEEQPIEHFGFRDGISNPLFLKSDQETVNAYGGDTHWKPWAPLKLALVQDPLYKDGYGSYLVFRKLEQHVHFFETIIRTFAADKLGLNPESEEDLEYTRALLMGRFRDGTPLTLRDSSYTYGNKNYNNFTYTDETIGTSDSNGTKCPFHAHIRKMNPRDDPQESDKKYQGTETGAKDSKDRRIVRRGMTYGDRNKQLESQGLSLLPDSGIGLLFMCYQSDIKEQFEYLQGQMANNADFPEKKTGLDPITGQFDPELKFDEESKEWSSSTPPPQQWPFPWDSGNKLEVDALQSCVTLKGGEYFFAPSIGFLQNIIKY